MARVFARARGIKGQSILQHPLVSNRNTPLASDAGSPCATFPRPRPRAQVPRPATQPHHSSRLHVRHGPRALHPYMRSPASPPLAAANAAALARPRHAFPRPASRLATPPALTRYTTLGSPMKDMATLRRRFMPPEYFCACFWPTLLLNRLTDLSAAVTAADSSGPAEGGVGWGVG